MNDIAHLGFDIDPRTLTKVADDISKVGAAAAQTERATDKMVGSVNKATQAQTHHTTATQAAAAQTARAVAVNDNLSRSAAAASMALGRVGVNVPLLAAGLGIIGAVGAAIGAIGATSVKAVAAFREFEEHSLALNSMLKATGFAAGRTAEDIEKMVTEIGNIGEVRKAAIELIKFRAIATDVFDRALVAADDLSAAGFGSISSAAGALGKALESPAEGLTRLRRAGIIFTDQQIAMVKNMQETGRLAEAQKFVLDELAKKVGGAGAARDQGLSGSYEALGDATKRLLEHWGKQITEGLRLTAVIKSLADQADRSVQVAASPKLQLGLVDTAIEDARRRIGEQAGSPGLRAGAEATLNRLLAQREKLLQQVAVAEKRAADARTEATAAADTAATERQIDLIKGVVEALGRETEQLRKNAFERAVDIELRKAEAAGPNSPGRGEIERAVNIKMATEATTAAVEASKLQTATLKIEAETLGMSVGAAAAYRVEMEFLAQQKIKGVEVSAAQTAALREEAKAQGEAAQAAALAKVQSDIKFDRATMFLSDTDVQIAQNLQHLYGNDIPRALASSEAAGMRFNAALRSVKDMAGDALQAFAQDIRPKTAATATTDAVKDTATTADDTETRRHRPAGNVIPFQRAA